VEQLQLWIGGTGSSMNLTPQPPAVTLAGSGAPFAVGAEAAASLTPGRTALQNARQVVAPTRAAISALKADLVPAQQAPTPSAKEQAVPGDVHAAEGVLRQRLPKLPWRPYYSTQTPTTVFVA